MYGSTAKISLQGSRADMEIANWNRQFPDRESKGVHKIKAPRTASPPTISKTHASYQSVDTYITVCADPHQKLSVSSIYVCNVTR